MKNMKKNNEIAQRRVTIAERSNPEYIQQSIKELAADLLWDIKKSAKSLDPREKIQLLGKLLPLCTNNGEKSQKDATMELLVQKAIKVSLRVKNASQIEDGTIEEIE